MSAKTNTVWRIRDRIQPLFPSHRLKVDSEISEDNYDMELVGEGYYEIYPVRIQRVFFGLITREVSGLRLFAIGLQRGAPAVVFSRRIAPIVKEEIQSLNERTGINTPIEEKFVPEEEEVVFE